MACRASLIAALAVYAAALVGCGSDADQPGETDSQLTIAVIPKGTTHEFWKSIHAGAVRAERELDGVRVIWKGPIVEDDRAAQIEVVETFTAKRVDGIAVAPLDDRALVRPIRAARDAGIPVVILDSGLQDPDAYVSFVATDNYNGGAIAGRAVAEALGQNGGRVILLRYQVGSASTANREKGFLDEIAKHPAIEVLSADQYAGPTVETAMTAAETLLTKFGPRQVDAIFCPNESSTYGMLQALRRTGHAGNVRFVGFDVSEKLIEALRDGQLHALVVQNPFRMGYEGVRTTVAAARGQSVPPRIDTGVTLVTADNLADPDVDRLIHPPLKEYLE